MIQIFKRAIRLMLWDWSTLILFELIYKFGAMIIAFPLLEELLRFAMQRAGLKYLSNQNVLLILKSPMAILVLVVLVILLAFYIYIEITAIIIYCDQGMKGEKISVTNLFVQAIKKASYILKPQNGLLILFVIVIIPVTGFLLTTEILSSFQIPEFILDFIHKSPVLRLSYMSLLILLELLVIRWIFSIYEVTLQNRSFKEARKISRDMIKGKIIKTTVYFLIWTLFVTVVKWMIYLMVIGVSLILVQVSYSGSNLKNELWFNYTMLSQGRLFFDALIQFVLGFGFISALYYSLNETYPSTEQVIKQSKGRKRVIRGLIKGMSIAILLGFYFDYNVNRDWISGIRNMNPNTKVIAHRGASLFAPENTLAALEEAVKLGANYAEIDVQQLKDGELILMHDTNFKRTTGENKNVWESTYEEVKTYDAGSSFNPHYVGEQIPKLEDAIVYAKDKIDLMIELKLTGYEEGLEEKVVELIEKYKLTDQCMIVSMNYDVLTKVKAMNPAIKTGYITAVAYGDFEELDGVDAYSIEASFATEFLVRTLKSRGKEVFVWTLNNEKPMLDMIKLGVDGIITDNPDLAHYALGIQEERWPLFPFQVGQFEL
ncbi:glycerophosphodiester phosphodiesterase [Niameybacter massiliensis]|uniref:glycerophosphodiester phosphodiesterase n=1 Tax=Niameybacter massiliensis TaxID=1658108 RepID=UPI0006B59CAF|nr:glycerophosphodiester phosphodiesterase [Niameybacter massiliensis]